MLFEFYVYILTNRNHSVLYVGVTNNLPVRHYEHKTKINPRSFTARYNIDKLVYYEGFDSIVRAKQRETYLKGKSRKFKIELINKMNPYWLDLSVEFNEESGANPH